MADRKSTLSGYNRIRIKTAIDAEIFRSDSFGIDVETGPMSPVSIRKKREVLTIRRPLCWFVFGLFFRLSRARVKIAMPELRELTISGNSSARAAGFDSTYDFYLVISESGRLSSR